MEPDNARPAAARPADGRRARREARQAARRAEPAAPPAPADGLAWGAALHALDAPRLLTAADPRAADPPGFRGRLYPPQATLLAAMVALERRPLLRVDAGAAGEAAAQARCARLSECFSFGKTVLALALVCAQKEPARLPGLAPLQTHPPNAPRRGATLYPPLLTCAQSFMDDYRCHIPEIAVHHTRTLPVTVVVAVANIISQWEAEARRFTSLRFFTIDHVRSLRAFEAVYRGGGGGGIDLLLVKAGRASASFAVAGEPPAQKRTRSILEGVARILEGVPVARLIVDDYDTLQLSRDDCFVPAHFTWLISATRRLVPQQRYAAAAADTVSEFFGRNLEPEAPILEVAADNVINRVFSLHCDPAYVEAFLSTTALGFRRIFVRGGLAFARLLRALDVDDGVVEMLNGAAVATAAQALGLESGSLGELIRRIVGAQLGRLRAALRARARVARARAALAAAADVRAAPAADAAALVSALVAAVKERTDEEAAEAIAAAVADVPGRRVAAALDALDEWADEQCEKHGAALNRMRDNVREGHCQCCMVPFADAAEGADADAAEGADADAAEGADADAAEGADADAGADAEAGAEADAAYILSGCCQIVVCESCITRRDDRGTHFIRRCPNCLHPLALRTDLIRVGAELDLSAALADGQALAGERVLALASEGDTDAADASEGDTDAADASDAAAAGDAAAGAAGADAAAPAGEAAPAIADPKLRALVQLVSRAPAIDCLRDAPAQQHVPGLISGRRDAPWPADKPWKFLVFAMYTESAARIRGALEQAGVAHCVLQGTRAQKDEAVRRFRDEAAVLLVTTPRDCGGLHLPFTSHVVFFHRVIDPNVEAQVIGRGQRLGREHNLEVVTLANEAEAEGL